jgi:ubiquinone/menaquinone biosynthesis C-methylase UbiE
LENPGNRAARAELTEEIVRSIRPAVAAEAPVLDCGCGTGWVLEALAAHGLPPDRLHGVDRDPDRVAAARQRVPGATVVEADAGRLPFADGTFGVVLFVVSLSSMGGGEEVRNALLEARRVLAPGGMVVVYELALPNPLNRQTRLVGRRELAAAGLSTAEERRLTLLPPLGRRLGRSAPWAYPALARLRPLRSHRLYVCR